MSVVLRFGPRRSVQTAASRLRAARAHAKLPHFSLGSMIASAVAAARAAAVEPEPQCDSHGQHLVRVLACPCCLADLRRWRDGVNERHATVIEQMRREAAKLAGLVDLLEGKGVLNGEDGKTYRSLVARRLAQIDQFGPSS